MISSCLLAAHAAVAETTKPLAHLPGATVMGMTGNNTTGYADMMLPLVGHPQSFIHLNPQGLIHGDNEYTLSLGGGFRHLSDNAGI